MSVSDNVWVERYRPQTIDDIIGHEEIKDLMTEFVDDSEMPNLLFAGPQGVGKTAMIQAFAKEKYGDSWRNNVLEMNASDQRGIGDVRDTIKGYARQGAIDSDFKIIFLDEADQLCVPPGTKIITGYPSAPKIKKIEDVAEDGESIPSVNFDTNQIQSDEGRLVDSGVADFFNVQLLDGRSFSASLKHPFFVVGDDGKLVEKELRELEAGDEIADFKNDIGISQCLECEEWTSGKYCSKSCKNSAHSKFMSGEGNHRYGEDGWNKGLTKEDDKRVAAQANYGQKNGNWNGEWHAPHWSEDEELKEEVVQKLSKAREDKTYVQIFDSEEAAYKERIKRGDGNYRYHLKDKSHVECEICGEKKKVGGRDGIYVHHIDGDRENNDEENLMDVCPRCHNFVCHDRMQDLKGGWKENPYRKDIVSDGGIKNVDTVKIESIEYDHRGKAYNITMDGTPNFMLANGILTHNTNDAQPALRRIMEDYSDVTRFVLSCNYPNQIIDPLQSRCAPFYFDRLTDSDVRELIVRVLSGEGIEFDEETVMKLAKEASGDGRKAINMLQVSVDRNKMNLNSEWADVMVSVIDWETIKEIVDEAITGELDNAMEMLDSKLIKQGVDHQMLCDAFLAEIKRRKDIPADSRVKIITKIADCDYRINFGANPHVQFHSLICDIHVARHLSLPNYREENN